MATNLNRFKYTFSKKSIALTINFLIALLIGSSSAEEKVAVKTTTQSYQMVNIIEVKARVEQFIPNAMWDSFESGAVASYDATEIEIIAPLNWEGEKLTIYHDRHVEADSPWRIIGQKLQFSLEKDALNSENIIFDGSIDGLDFYSQD